LAGGLPSRAPTRNFGGRGSHMRKLTSQKVLPATFVFIALVCAPIPVLAQHGGGGHGGGGGSHGGGGGFSRGSGYSGGGFSGGSRGSFSGGRSFGGGRSSFGGMRSGSAMMRGSGASRPWSWEGRGARNAAPGWHHFERSGNAGMSSRSGGTFGRSGRGVFGGRPGGMASRAAMADGNGHSFGGMRAGSGVRTGALLASNGRFGGNSFNRAGFGFRDFRGGFGNGWGWGRGWGCCGWGYGWGWGFGWWDPFWAWPPYAYSPWLYDYSPEYIYPNY
jgi:hypothetical protein